MWFRPQTWGGLDGVKAGLIEDAGASSSTGFAGPVDLYNVGLGLCNHAGKGIWLYWTWAGHIWCTGP
jgi:hypothetical protein